MTTTANTTPAPSTSSCAANPTPPSAGRASTNNWDTAFAINFANANKAIKAQKSSPPSFSGTKPGGGFSGPAVDIAGTFGDWQLSGGSGSLAQMTLPISGTATAQSNPPQSLNFNGSATVQIELAYLPQPGAPGSSKTSGGTSNALKAKLTTDDPQARPIVTVTAVKLNPEASDAVDVVKDVLGEWLLANLDSFNHTFAAVDLGAVADKDSFTWLLPTKIGYGINNAENASVDDYVFGVLAMTENRPGVNLGYDVSPNIIPSGCNAGFLISQERFMTKIMKPGISALFLKAKEDDFTVTGDGSTITNTNAVTFHNFETSNKSGSQTIPITGAGLDPNKFTLVAGVTTMTLSFTDLHFPWDGGGYTVHLDYNAESELYMDSNRHLQACTVSKPSLAVTVTESSAEKWTNLIVGIVEGIAFAVAGAAIGGALGPVADGAGDALEGAGAEAVDGIEGTTEALDFEGDMPADDEIDNLDEVNSEDDEDAADEVANSDDESYTSKFKSFFRRNWRKILGMAIGGAVGVVYGKLPDILEAYSEGDLEKMPTLDEFVDYSVAPVAWPGQTGYSLVSVSLNESLQIGLNVNLAD